MKNFLLSLSAFLGMALVAQAASLNPKGLDQVVPNPGDHNLSAPFSMEIPVSAGSTFKAPQKADADAPEVPFSYAGAPSSATMFNSNTVSAGTKVTQMMKVPKSVVSNYAGSQVSKFYFYTGCRNDGTYKNYVKNYTFYIKESLYGANIYEQSYTVTGDEMFQLQTVVLDTPFTLEAGKDYFFGCYAAIINTSDFTIVFDELDNIEDGSIIGYLSSTGWKYQYLSDAGFGCNCIGIYIAGENLPLNMASADDYSTVPLHLINTPFEIQALITNRGGNDINEVELSCTLGDKEPVVNTVTLSSPLAPGAQAIISTAEVSYPDVADELPFTLAVTKVNGVDNGFSMNSLNGAFQFIETGYTKNVVVEKFTGTWCGWCPRGIVGFEALSEAHPDGTFIPVAVHIGSDPMKAKSWTNMVNTYNSSGGAPASVINRTYSSDPNASDLEYIYSYLHAMPAVAEVAGVTVQWSDDSYQGLDVKVTSHYAKDFTGSDPAYTLQFAVLENGVGPYNQTNNYSGGSYGDMGGWGSKGSSVKTVYDHVARYLDTFPMIEGSVPTTIEKGKDYEFEHSIDISKTNANIKNRDNEHVDLVVYIIDTANGRIENALHIPGSEFEAPTKTGLNEIVTDANAPVEYYNLQGARVGSDAKGLVIRKQGDKVEKVIL